MKTRRSKLGLSILAGGLSFVGGASAVDLIVNGSFENSNAGEWKYFNTYNYSSAYFTGPPVPASENPGTKWSWQHASTFGAWTNFVTPLNVTDLLQSDLVYADSQTVNLTNALTGSAVDASLGRFAFSSWLASYGKPSSNPEQPFLVLRFYDSSGSNQLGSDVIFDRTINTFAVTYADPGKGTNIPSDLSSDHDWIKYSTDGTIPAGARKATVYITRSPNAGLSGTPDTYVDLVKLDVLNINDTTILETAIPADGQNGVAADAEVHIGLRDIATQVNTNSIRFSFDGVPVTPAIQKSGTLTTVLYQPPALLAPFSTHTYGIGWSDNGSPVTSKTNEFTFSVAPYSSVNLGPPLYLENFDELAEGTLPSGWSATNATDPDIPGLDLNNFHSDSYLNWVVISMTTLSNLFNVTPGGSDYLGTLDVAPNQFVNGLAVTNLINTNFILAASTDRFGNQVQTLFTRDYDLRGKTNVYLSFHSIYTQNQNSLGSVEYSINGGATWLPALYMLDGPSILHDARGNIDASNTLAVLHTDVPPPGNYGAFIAVSSIQWAGLAPFISARVNNDQIESKRVELVRLVQADNQATVRFRFEQAGQNSWFFGIDDFGIYSLSVAAAPLVSSAPASQTAVLGNSTSLSVSALGAWPLTYQWRHDGTNLAGFTGQNLVLPRLSASDAGSYEVVISNAAGSVTSSPPAIVNVINPPVFVTGQWDFNGDLRATYGKDLQFYDISVQTNSSFKTTTSFGIPDINGTPAVVMFLTPTSGNSGVPGANPTTEAWGGYKMLHGAAANGGGTNVNQYTIIYDVLYPSSADLTWRALLQASPTVVTGGDDSEFYINTTDGIGISSTYNGTVTPDTWHRIALAVDLSGPGVHPVVAKFIDGAKVGEQTTGLSGVDGRFSLLTSLALLFAEDNAYNNDAYVSSVQFSDGRRPDAFIEALGKPTASKIPGVIKADIEAGNVAIRWTGGVPLQSADTLAGPWTTVNGATSPYTPPGSASSKFYRPQIP